MSNTTTSYEPNHTSEGRAGDQDTPSTCIRAAQTPNTAALVQARTPLAQAPDQHGLTATPMAATPSTAADEAKLRRTEVQEKRPFR